MLIGVLLLATHTETVFNVQRTYKICCPVRAYMLIEVLLLVTHTETHTETVFNVHQII